MIVHNTLMALYNTYLALDNTGNMAWHPPQASNFARNSCCNLGYLSCSVTKKVQFIKNKITKVKVNEVKSCIFI